MRPELAAFRELDTLVRNLTEQLANYRRRALSTEARCRTLENEVEALRTRLAEAQRAPEVSDGATSTPVAAATTASPAAGASEPAARPAVQVSDSDLARENLELRELLGHARERTAVLVDRVRFLRQQMTVEK